MLFDSHTHINNETFTDEQREALVEEIKASDVSLVMDVGFDIPSSYQVVKDTCMWDGCYGAVGVHPHDAKTMDREALVTIEELSKEPKIKAIGEIGLDFYYDHSDRDVQRRWFREQIRLANSLGMPIIIHSRDADRETFDILQEEGAFSPERQSRFPQRKGPGGISLPDSRVVIHCFSGSSQLAREYVDKGATIGICGPVTFKNNKKTVKVVEEIPLEFLLVETDAPYLTPEPFRGRPNKSPYVRYTTQRVAEIKGLSCEAAAQATYVNAKTFFGIE